MCTSVGCRELSGAHGPPQLQKNAPRIWAEVLASNGNPTNSESRSKNCSQIGFSYDLGRELRRESPGILRIAPRMAFSIRERVLLNLAGSQPSEAWSPVLMALSCPCTILVFYSR